MINLLDLVVNNKLIYFHLSKNYNKFNNFMKDQRKLYNKNLKFLNKMLDEFFYKHTNQLNPYQNFNSIELFLLRMMPL